MKVKHYLERLRRDINIFVQLVKDSQVTAYAEDFEPARVYRILESFLDQAGITIENEGFEENDDLVDPFKLTELPHFTDVIMQDGVQLFDLASSTHVEHGRGCWLRYAKGNEIVAKQFYAGNKVYNYTKP